METLMSLYGSFCPSSIACSDQISNSSATSLYRHLNIQQDAKRYAMPCASGFSARVIIGVRAFSWNGVREAWNAKLMGTIVHSYSSVERGKRGWGSGTLEISMESVRLTGTYLAQDNKRATRIKWSIPFELVGRDVKFLGEIRSRDQAEMWIPTVS